MDAFDAYTRGPAARAAAGESLREIALLDCIDSKLRELAPVVRGAL